MEKKLGLVILFVLIFSGCTYVIEEELPGSKIEYMEKKIENVSNRVTLRCYDVYELLPVDMNTELWLSDASRIEEYVEENTIGKVYYPEVRYYTEYNRSVRIDNCRAYGFFNIKVKSKFSIEYWTSCDSIEIQCGDVYDCQWRIEKSLYDCMRSVR